LVIGIDDAHLLDELSVTLLHQLTLTRTASVVLTVRTGEPAPDPVVTLWKNGLADRLELAQLPRVDMDRLVTGVLGGVVDSRTIERLSSSCGSWWRAGARPARCGCAGTCGAGRGGWNPLPGYAKSSGPSWVD
jgi:hypothetical protein